MSAQPDYAVSPGDFLRDWLEENSTTQLQLANDIGVSRKHISAILAGSTLSADIAAKLALATGYSARWWMKIESQHRADIARIALEKELAGAATNVSAKVTKFLRAQGYIHSTLRTPGLMMAEVLAFFSVATVDALNERFARPAAAFRQQLLHEIDWQSVAVWLRVGDLKFKEVSADLVSYDAKKFELAVHELPKLSSGDPELYQQQISDRLAKAGAAVLYVPEVEGCRAHGVTRWIDGHPVIQLSGRGKSDTEFWFSLMHEVHHVLNDPHEDLLMQGPATAANDPREVAANRFAADAIVPPLYFLRLSTLHSFDSIQALADELGIAPGLIVGRLHHEELKDPSWGNSLKKRLLAA